MAYETREKIITKALELFTKKGYAETTLRDLAKELGISKSALYVYFESKEDLWNGMMSWIEDYYKARMGSMENLPSIPKTLYEFQNMAMFSINYTMSDEYITLTRKLLCSEQYRDKKACYIANQAFLQANVDLYKYLFSGMIKNGLLKDEDPEMLAFCFTSPITALIHENDREPNKRLDTMDHIKDFIEHFIKVYSK